MAPVCHRRVQSYRQSKSRMTECPGWRAMIGAVHQIRHYPRPDWSGDTSADTPAYRSAYTLVYTYAKEVS